MKIHRMFAHKHPNRFEDFGQKRYVAAFGGNAPIVEVEITEDPDGDYHGCYDIKDGQEVFSNPLLYKEVREFTICFAYGAEIEQERGKIRIARFTVKEVVQATEN